MKYHLLKKISYQCTFIFLIGIFLTGCLGTHHRYPSGGDGAPAFHVDESKIPDAIPKNEPISRYGNPKSYYANGQRYYVQKSYFGYDEKGIASWYGTKFHKQRTSSGEPYDMLSMTAAHKTLPIPCYARVTNLNNGRQVTVKINDRGPFRENRIIDLSFVAAKKLGIYPVGTGLVRVTTIDPRQPQPTTPQIVSTSGLPPTLYLQIGAFAVQQNAERLVHHIRHYTQHPIQIKRVILQARPIYRVQIGPLNNVDDSDQLHDALRAARLGNPITVIQ